MYMDRDENIIDCDTSQLPSTFPMLDVLCGDEGVDRLGASLPKTLSPAASVGAVSQQHRDRYLVLLK